MLTWIINLFINVVAASCLVPQPARCWFYRLYGINIKTTWINPRCFFGGNNIKIGERTFINYGCFFDNSSSISIGKNCSIGMEVMLCTSNHEQGTADQRAGKATGLPIEIGDGCWIGTRAVILPGVVIGNGCVIAAGALVTKDCEPNSLYTGVPARKIREL